MRRFLSAALLPLLAMLVGCDDKGGGAAKSADKNELKRSEAQALPSAVKPAVSYQAGGEGLRDAVAAVTPGNVTGPLAGKNAFDKLYDNAAVTNGDVTTDGVVVGGNGSTSKDPNALVNAKPKKISPDGIVVPSPLDGATTDGGVVANGGGTVDPAKTTAAGFPPMDKKDPLATAPSGLKAKAKNPADEQKEQILLIGDSHMANGANTLFTWLPKKLTGVGNRVVDVYGSGGAAATWYNPGKGHVKLKKMNVRSTLDVSMIDGSARLAELVTARTKVVIIELGSNHVDWTALSKGQPAAFYHLDASEALARAAAAGGRKCFWIGQPDMTGLKGTDPAKARAAISDYEAKLSAKVSGSCTYVKISDKTTYAGGDGIHYGNYEPVAAAAAAQIKLP